MIPTQVELLKGQRILIVDDEVDSLELVTFLLAEYGADTVAATNTREALQLFLDFAPDAIVCDLAMPEEDGFSFIRKVRELQSKRKRRLLTIALTALATEESILKARTSGFQTCLLKPFDPDELLALLAGFLSVPSPLRVAFSWPKGPFQ